MWEAGVSPGWTLEDKKMYFFFSNFFGGFGLSKMSSEYSSDSLSILDRSEIVRTSITLFSGLRKLFSL